MDSRYRAVLWIVVARSFRPLVTKSAEKLLEEILSDVVNVGKIETFYGHAAAIGISRDRAKRIFAEEFAEEFLIRAEGSSIPPTLDAVISAAGKRLRH